jgi:hypothetical protein
METRTSTSPAREPGRLTAMMRAAHIPSLPRVLRVGLVSGGKVTYEHTCDSFPVTLGADEGSSLVIRGMRGRHTLFAMRDGVLSLCLLPGMTGRMVSEEGPVELGSVTMQAARTGLTARLPISTLARGRIDFEGTRILFQFVERPIPMATPRLPLAATTGPQIDWTLAMICAMSFLLHFGFLGAMYSDWADPIVRDDLMVGALVDMEQRLPVQPQSVEMPDEPQKPASQTDAKRADAKKPEGTSTSASRNAQDGKAPASDQKSDPGLMASRADGMMMAILTAQSENAPATELALRRSEIPAIDLGKADGNVREGVSELTFRSQAPVSPGRPHDLSTLGITHATAENKPGQPREIAVPFTMDLPPTVASVKVSNADRVIASLRPKFRKCYTDGLANDASQQGALMVRVKIAPTGEVASVNVTSNTGLSADVAACVAKRVQNAQFDAPGGTGSTLDVPVKFVHQ